MTTRLVAVEDAAELAALAVANREHLAPWQPTVPDRTLTEAGQAELVRIALASYEQGVSVPHVILDGDGSIIGRIGLTSVIRGAFQSASIAYWVSRGRTGHGVASAAVALMVARGFGELGLHRVQGETLPHNTASRRVLERNGFVEYGVAPSYLRIAGRWQEHVLYQRVHDGWREDG